MCKILRWGTQGQGETSVHGNAKGVAKNYQSCWFKHPFPWRHKMESGDLSRALLFNLFIFLKQGALVHKRKKRCWYSAICSIPTYLIDAPSFTAIKMVGMGDECCFSNKVISDLLLINIGYQGNWWSNCNKAEIHFCALVWCTSLSEVYSRESLVK